MDVDLDAAAVMILLALVSFAIDTGHGNGGA